VKKVSKKKYLVFEHVGKMALIKDTINKIYKEFIPNHKFVPNKSEFFHFERYDKKFYWDSHTSIIDIYVPIIEESIKEEDDIQEAR
jgi:predicted transcriptional regulator YdeE